MFLIVVKCPIFYKVWRKAFFSVGTRCRAASHLCSHSSKKMCLRRQVINRALPEQVRTWGNGSLRLNDFRFQPRVTNPVSPWHPRQAASTDSHWNQDTTDLIRVPRNTASQSVSWLTKSGLNTKTVGLMLALSWRSPTTLLLTNKNGGMRTSLSFKQCRIWYIRFPKTQVSNYYTIYKAVRVDQNLDESCDITDYIDSIFSFFFFLFHAFCLMTSKFDSIYCQSHPWKK